MGRPPAEMIAEVVADIRAGRVHDLQVQLSEARAEIESRSPSISRPIPL